MSSANAVLEQGEALEDAIRQAPGQILPLWSVYADDEPGKCLFVSLDTAAATDEMRRLRDLHPGRKFVCSSGTAKVTRSVVEVPLEFASAE